MGHGRQVCRCETAKVKRGKQCKIAPRRLDSMNAGKGLVVRYGGVALLVFGHCHRCNFRNTLHLTPRQ
eukprot:g5962.t1